LWIIFTNSSSTTEFAPTFLTAFADEFQAVTVNDITSAIRRLSDKCCAADTLPTSQLKLVADLIAPCLTKLFNRSLSTATVLTMFKAALITPLLKKPD